MRSQERKADGDNFGHDHSFDWNRQEIGCWRDHDRKEDWHDRDFDGEEEFEYNDIIVAFGINQENFNGEEDDHRNGKFAFAVTVADGR